MKEPVNECAHYNAASLNRLTGHKRVSLDRFSGAAFERLFTAAQSRELDRLATAARHSGHRVDEARGPRRVDDAARRWPEVEAITVVCGRGNNAGDGYIVAGCALSSGVAVQLIQLGRADALTGDAALARDWAVALGVSIEEVDGERRPRSTAAAA